MHIHVIGDIHGNFQSLVKILATSKVIDAKHNWIGGEDQVWLLGDLFDRGTQGTECVELLMSLDKQAAKGGGIVNSILGNHDLMFLAANRFADHDPNMLKLWLGWGGSLGEMDKIQPHHLSWLKKRPAIALIANHLLIHCDGNTYGQLGRSIEEVNFSMQQVLSSGDSARWRQTLNILSARAAYSVPLLGWLRARKTLAAFGGKMIIHGHTPIPVKKAGQPYIYANGLCCNVDAGVYLGRPGFAYQI